MTASEIEVRRASAVSARRSEREEGHSGFQAMGRPRSSATIEGDANLLGTRPNERGQVQNEINQVQQNRKKGRKDEVPRRKRDTDEEGIESSSNNDWCIMVVSTLLLVEARHGSEHGGDAKLNG
jgi:hypothetical protein